MSRPPKSQLVLVSEEKSHRTKSELETRKKAEKNMKTTKKMRCRFRKEENPVAYAEFKRIAGLLEAVDKNDALYEAAVNRYCQIYSECLNCERQSAALSGALEDLDELFQARGIEAVAYFKQRSDMQAQLLALDKQLMGKRKMLFDIEKENIMTIASSLRAVPKAPSKTPESEDPIAKLRRSRGG